MERKDDEVQIEIDELRGGSTPNVVRWVLLISLTSAIVLLSAIWIFGAWSHDRAESRITSTEITTAEDATGDIDGVLLTTTPQEAAVPSKEPELRNGLEVIEN